MSKFAARFPGPPALAVGLASAATQTLYSTPAVSTLQTGHGWGSANNDSGDMNYTSDFYQGSQCIKMVTSGAGSGTKTTVTSPRMDAIDMTGKMLRLLIKIDSASIAKLTRILVWVGSGASAFAAASDASLYNSALNVLWQPLRADEWSEVLINPVDLVEVLSGTFDWAALRDIRISAWDNASGPVTILFGGWSIVAQDAGSPHGVISITFDDGIDTCHSVAAPKMDAYDYPATIYVVRERIGSGGDYLTLAHLQSLYNASGWEVGLHSDAAATHALTHGLASMANAAAAVADLQSEQVWLRANGMSGGQFSLSYPHGAWTTALAGTLRSYVQSGRTTAGFCGGIAKLPVSDPLWLSAWQVGTSTAVTPNSTILTMEWAVDQVYNYGGWLILCFHRLPAVKNQAEDVLPADFNTLIDYIAAKGVPVKTVGQVLAGA